MQVLSPANLVPNFENEAVAVEAAKILNDGYAELTHRLPKRFKAYVSLPMPHVDASLREMERGLDQLGFAGVYSGCSILDRPVTEKEFDPVYNEMNRRGSIDHPADSAPIPQHQNHCPAFWRIDLDAAQSNRQSGSGDV